jgi:hypothetical protein
MKGAITMEKNASPRISQEMLRYLADFAGVRLSEDRLERTTPRVELYQNNVNRLDDVDLTGIEPAVAFSVAQELNNER